MEKSKKVGIVIFLVIIVIAICVGVFFILNNKNKNSSESVAGEELASETYEKEIIQIEEEAINNELAVINDIGNKVNISDVIAYEKFILDDKVGMSGFNIMSDLDTTTITYVIKNHTKENIDGFKYRLELLNFDDTVSSVIDMESKPLPPLAKYQVTIKVENDVVDTYDIYPTTEFVDYKTLGGEDSEN